jgi:jasmonate O-methyltransferase
VIDRAKFNSFYVPLYGPSDKELREIIQEEGSFSISDMRVHDRSSSLNNPNTTASWVANQLRAAFEPIVVQHFGEVMDEFVRTAEKRWSVEGSLEEELARYPRAQLVVLLAKKA